VSNTVPLPVCHCQYRTMEHDDSPPASPIRKVYNDGDDEGECEMLNLPENIYTCAFVLAQNATPGM
jgi:hypothetical protein